jgi:hypothetical protein
MDDERVYCIIKGCTVSSKGVLYLQITMDDAALCREEARKGGREEMERGQRGDGEGAEGRIW